MTFAGYNQLAIIVAAVTSFLFGGLWYGLFSRQWLSAANIKEKEIQKVTGGSTMYPYVVAFIAQLVMAWTLAGLIGHLSPKFSIRTSLIVAGLVWAGFILTTQAVNHAFQMQPRALTAIDSGHWLGVLLLQALVIGWFGLP